MKIIGLIFWAWALAFAVNVALGEIENGFAKTEADPKILTISVIDSDKADTLFKKFIQNKDIPFRYPFDGCNARATAMARMAESEKIQMGKIYAEGSLQVKTGIAKFPLAQWGWHVAPMAYIKQHDGKIEPMVFDPSLFSRPASIEEWKQKMLDESYDYKPSISELYYGGRFQYFPRTTEGYKNSWRKSDLDSSQKTIKYYKPLQDVLNPSKSGAGQQIQGAR